MTPLRQRMLDALVLHGKAPRTQEAYISAVAQLARHYRRSPDSLNGAEIEAYLLHLLRERQLTRSTVNQAGCAINFLFGKVLGRDGSPCRIPLPHGPQRLPEILSRDEIARLLGCARTLKARTVLSCAYALGLRVSELCALRVSTPPPTACACAWSRARGPRTATCRCRPTCSRCCAAITATCVHGAGCSARRPIWRSRCTPSRRSAGTGRRATPPASTEGRRHPWLAPLLRHPSAGVRCRLAQHLAVARPPPRQHHGALPAPGAARRARRRPPHAADAAVEPARVHAALKRRPLRRRCRCHWPRCSRASDRAIWPRTG